MSAPGGTLAVLGPSPLLSITFERGADGTEVHLHPAGQGFWVARLAAILGADVTFCCALGGESGRVLHSLIGAEHMTLRAARAASASGVYVHDRRGGERVELVNVESAPLDRHSSDELYGIALAAGLNADLTLVTGCQPPDFVGADLYRRLVGDLRANGRPAIADLTGPGLAAALEGGVELLRLSDQELVAEGYAPSDAVQGLVAGARRLQSDGARHVIVSRASEPALLVGEEERDGVMLRGPVFEALDARGTGDAMFAAIGAGLARGLGLLDALRLGVAAGALNATRRGLGSGTRAEIEELAGHVDTVPLADADADAAGAPGRGSVSRAPAR